MQQEYHVYPLIYLDAVEEKIGSLSSVTAPQDNGVAGNVALIRSINWAKAEKGQIDFFPWADFERPYFPRSYFYILHEADNLYLLLLTQGEEEKEARAEVMSNQGAVHLDSCLEFFLAPYTHTELYFNFEVNAKGYYKIAAGASRNERYCLDQSDLKDFVIQSFTGDTLAAFLAKDICDWGIFLKIPLRSLDRLAQRLLPETTDLLRGADSMRANVYKCGDMTAKPHYACWSNIQTLTADFHCPEFFGKIILEE